MPDNRWSYYTPGDPAGVAGMDQLYADTFYRIRHTSSFAAITIEGDNVGHVCAAIAPMAESEKDRSVLCRTMAQLITRVWFENVPVSELHNEAENLIGAFVATVADTMIERLDDE